MEERFSIQPLDQSRARGAFEHFILFLFALYLLVDSLNGFLSLKLGLPSLVSIAYKQVLLLCLFVYAFRYSHTAFLQGAGIFCVLLGWACLRFFLVDNVGFFHSLVEAVKVAYFFLVFAIVSHFTVINDTLLERIFKVFVLVLLLNVFMSLIGIGFSTYGEFGAKGFFYAGNALSGIIVLISTYYMCLRYRASFRAFLMVFLFFLVLSVVIGTKSGILGVFLAAGLVVLFNANSRVVMFAMALLVGLIVAAFQFYEQLMENPILSRMEFFYEQGGVGRLLFSGREDKFMEIMPAFLDAGFVQLLFGFDYYQLHRLHYTLTEFDVADMFIQFGSLFSLLVFLAYCAVFLKITRCVKSPLSQAAWMSFLVLLCIATIAGHVFFNGTVTPLWGLVCGAAIAVHRQAGKSSLLPE